MHFGALRWLHSTHPYGKIEYDSRFDMIDVVPFEMIYDEFRVVVAWPTTTAAESGTTRFEMTYDCLFDMIYDYLFDRATVSLRPQVIKKLLPGEAKKSGLRQGTLNDLQSPQEQNKTKPIVDVNGDTMPWRKLLSKWHMIFYNFNMIKDDSHFEMKSYRFIIDRRFFACGVPAVRRLMRDQATYSRLK